jgi:hypothetical protein
MNSQSTLSTLLEGDLVAFNPVAYYDKFMDTIRVEFRDCSSTEVRLDETFTVIVANYSEDGEDACAGLVIKGIGHLFEKLGLPKSGVPRVVDLINRMIEKDLIAKDTQIKIAPIKHVAAAIELRVDFAEAKAA